MELKEMIKVMQHYEDGGEIEYTHNKLNSVFGEAIKKHDGNLGWDWDTYTYRITQPNQKVIIEKWLIKDVDSGEHFIMESSDANLTLKAFPNGCKVKLLETYEVELLNTDG